MSDQKNELFTDVYSLEEATLKGLITWETFLNEYKRLMQGDDKNDGLQPPKMEIN